MPSAALSISAGPAAEREAGDLSEKILAVPGMRD